MLAVMPIKSGLRSYGGLQSYLEDVFRSILFGTDRDKRDFLPCYYQAHELPKMNAIEVAKLLSTAA